MNTKHTQSFHAMPKDYAGLCGVFLPRPIHDKVGYENTVEIADVFAGFESEMTADQNDYFDLLCDLIGKHDQESTRPSKLRSCSPNACPAIHRSRTRCSLSSRFGSARKPWWA